MHFRSIIFIISLDAKWLNTDLLLVAGCCITWTLLANYHDSRWHCTLSSTHWNEIQRKEQRKKGNNTPTRQNGDNTSTHTQNNNKSQKRRKKDMHRNKTYTQNSPPQKNKNKKHTKQQQQKTAIPPQQHQEAQPTFKTQKITLTVQSISKVCGKNNTFCPGYLSESCIHYVWHIKIKVGDGIWMLNCSVRLLTWSWIVFYC